MDGPWGHYAKWSKSDKDKGHMISFVYGGILKKQTSSERSSCIWPLYQDLLLSLILDSTISTMNSVTWCNMAANRIPCHFLPDWKPPYKAGGPESSWMLSSLEICPVPELASEVAAGDYFPQNKYHSWVILWCWQWLPQWLSGEEPACQCRRCGFDLCVKQIAWRREWQPTPVILPGKFHGQRSLYRTIQPMGSQCWHRFC